MTANKTFPWPLLWLMLLFAVPLASATLLYVFQDRIPIKIVSNGELLTPPIPISSLDFIPTHADAEGKWQLVYLCQSSYQQTCEKNFDLLKRVHLSLGKDQNRVYLFHPILRDSATLKQNNQVLLIDPRGFLMMQYTITQEKSSKEAKGILEDIKRLLKFSHVG